ncbi:YebC/PmpR family DNA-binding transcriptional regulator [Candidatus Babeliales bacterium]|nr:YebC/PmpR family DNA-binding transcriptional regulator [Candidatus Babeliales bacterium]
MSGHSKWSNIKHKKAKEDSARGKAFTKLIKEITVAAREGGGDINGTGNPRLRTLIDKAKEINMPLENTKRAILKGTGELPGVNYEKYMYEGYGPGGIAVLVEVLTENKNRAVAELRHVFSKQGGNLAESGAVNWMFQHKGVIKAVGGSLSEDDLLEKLIDYDIDDISKHDDLVSIICDMPALNDIKEAVKKMGLTVEHAEIEWVAKDPLDLDDEKGEKAMAFLEALDALDDIQNLYSNLG